MKTDGTNVIKTSVIRLKVMAQPNRIFLNNFQNDDKRHFRLCPWAIHCINVGFFHRKEETECSNFLRVAEEKREEEREKYNDRGREEKKIIAREKDRCVKDKKERQADRKRIDRQTGRWND